MYLFYFYLDFSSNSFYKTYAGITNPFSYLMNSNIEFPCFKRYLTINNQFVYLMNSNTEFFCKYGDNITTQKENIIETTEEIDPCYNNL